MRDVRVNLDLRAPALLPLASLVDYALDELELQNLWTIRSPYEGALANPMISAPRCKL
jgi:hypothetical protein